MTKIDLAESETTYVNMPDPANPLDIAPVGGRIGVEIRGVALSGDMDSDTIAAIRAATARHKVVFFRNQQLDDEGQQALVARMGSAIAAGGGSHFLYELNSASDGYAADIWHTDQTYMPAPPDMTMLRAVVSPAAGGDTLWANTATAYTDLPTPLKALADNLWGIHKSTFDSSEVTGNVSEDKEWKETYRPKVYESEHPVVRVHPETGERALLTGFYMQRFAGFSGSDSRHLIAILQDHITRPENTVRWRWQPGDVAIWDNRASQHRAIVDFGSQLRVMKRATLAGSVPVGIDGRQGRALKLEPQAA
ncbi:TauD/TfdA family dioxygenase [Sphingobium sp. EM0848]|uniref:TauD/TfdA dioxygenase family protein n=1 Tax=Sphingobium sp. EM0848 TaxID=2743473 RepID=UPI00159C2A81|nr:TauD/TfdA family dioxygenase [Sphingobium sp. EM0848]